MKTIWEWTLIEFNNQTASAEPTPGGGSVASVCGSFGLGLIIMALEISIRKCKQSEIMEPTLHNARSLQGKLRAHADEDIAVFELYMQALRLPKTTDEERASRRKAISTAALAATDAPLRAAQDMLHALELGVRAVEFAKVEVLSDVSAGSDLLAGAVAATLRNVDINLSQLDPVSSERCIAARRQIEERSCQLHESISAAVKKSMGLPM